MRISIFYPVAFLNLCKLAERIVSTLCRLRCQFSRVFLRGDNLIAAFYCILLYSCHTAHRSFDEYADVYMRIRIRVCVCVCVCVCVWLLCQLYICTEIIVVSKYNWFNRKMIKCQN